MHNRNTYGKLEASSEYSLACPTSETSDSSDGSDATDSKARRSPFDDHRHHKSTPIKSSLASSSATFIFDKGVMALFSIFIIFFFIQIRGFRVEFNLMGQQQGEGASLIAVPSRSSQFNTLNPNPSWCPAATCNNSPTCQPCKQRFLIVIATGRSGSTTLINMLDLLPGVRMAGENNGHLFFSLAQMDNLKQTEEFRLTRREKVVGAWKHNPIPEGSLSCPIQNMFESMNPPPLFVGKQPNHIRTKSSSPNSSRSSSIEDEDEILGFKTVRFQNEETFGLSHEHSTNFLMEAFPCARFVINIRGDIQAQQSSWLKAFGKSMDSDEVRKYNRRLENVAAQLGPDRARLIDMSEWSRRDGSGLYVLNELVDWMGFRGCKFDELLHSNKDGYGRDEHRLFLGEHCRRDG